MISRLLICFGLAGPMLAEDLAVSFDKEFSSLGKDCSAMHSFMGCGETLFTGHPLHIAAGSLAPGNGIGVGLAMVSYWTPKKWRNRWSADAVGTRNGSWRAGGYVTLVRLTGNLLEEQPVGRLYSEVTSLNRVGYFGLGPATKDTARSFFGFREIVSGGSLVFPVHLTKKLRLALLGEANSRFSQVRASSGQASPSIEKLYTNATAPGLTDNPAYAQFGEGVRIRPNIGNLRLNYLVNLQQFAAPSNSVYSFQRLTVDLGHQFALYKNTRNLRALDPNGPNDCSTSSNPDVGSDKTYKRICPEIKFPTAQSRNLEGSIGFRLLIQESIVPGGHTVPFYMQPTLGGSDINGSNSLGSYQDYRFRGPNTVLLRANFEHSIWGPFGAMFAVDGGKVALRRGDVDFSNLVLTFSAGLTLRAGGFPMVHLLFSWGGKEGTHTQAAINTSLLGGGSRPSLY